MKRTHIPFYETYEDAKQKNTEKLHYFKVVAQTEEEHWYDCTRYTLYLLVDESDPDNMFVAIYNREYKRFIPYSMTVQQFLNTKYNNDMRRLLASVC